MLPDIKNVLYCTDLSQNSPIAFGYAAYLAKLTKADLHLLHVLEPLSEDAVVTLQTYVLDSKKRHEILDLRAEKARALLDERQEAYWAAQSAADQKIRAQVKSVTVCESYPSEQIIKSAEEHNCDLIVMGSHEPTARHIFLGSVARKVLHRSGIPSLVVPLAEVD